ncbi:MAG TPA: histidine phosphatase family protein [Thermoleophilaceae bacterium]|jgi:phosphohistidine phosphatase
MIWLLRHAEAEDGSPDAARPLTPHGEEQSRDAGAALKAMGVELELCLTSPRVRAEQTARLACEILGVEVQVDDRLSGGRFDLGELTTGFDEVMLVGHDPDFSMVVHETTGAQVRMKKGGLAGIDRGELKVLLRPRELAAMAH